MYKIKTQITNKYDNVKESINDINTSNLRNRALTLYKKTQKD